VISYERGRDREVLTTNGIYPKTLPGIAVIEDMDIRQYL
jgi:hypothetical protein